MPLNPIVYTEKVVRSFLRYQLTSYALADPGLYDQMREQLRVERLFDVRPLAELVAHYRGDLLAYVRQAFQQGWPVEDAEVTTDAAIAGHIDAMAERLRKVIGRLRKKLLWAFREIKRLNELRDQNGTLDYDEDAHFRRCDRLIKQLKGIGKRGVVTRRVSTTR